jgi:hypothetical protein
VVERQVGNKRAGSLIDGFLLDCTPCQVSKRATRVKMQDKIKQLPANLIHQVVVADEWYRRSGVLGVVHTEESKRNDCPEWPQPMVLC